MTTRRHVRGLSKDRTAAPSVGSSLPACSAIVRRGYKTGHHQIMLRVNMSDIKSLTITLCDAVSGAPIHNYLWDKVEPDNQREGTVTGRSASTLRSSLFAPRSNFGVDYASLEAAAIEQLTHEMPRDFAALFGMGVARISDSFEQMRQALNNHSDGELRYLPATPQPGHAPIPSDARMCGNCRHYAPRAGRTVGECRTRHCCVRERETACPQFRATPTAASE